MNIAFLAFLLSITAGLTPSAAQTPATTTESTATPCFRLLEEVEHYFGEITQNDTVEHTFLFRNECADTVEIESARTSCGCTSVVLTDRRVPPGGEARILAKFTPPRGSKGRISKSVSIYLVGESTVHTVLHVAATVHCAIDVEPSYIRVPDAVVGMRRTVQSTITNVSDSVVFVETTGVSLTSYQDEPGSVGGRSMSLSGGTVTPTTLRLKPGESGVLTIGFTPAVAGQLNGSVGLKIGDVENVIFLFGEVRAK
ncbi:MAG: DUF1573 domain-containing protein [Bacteroidetes bacterium]|nr:DUF1573 domain-containing protein [Bacteroidota bacterium]